MSLRRAIRPVINHRTLTTFSRSSVTGGSDTLNPFQRKNNNLAHTNATRFPVKNDGIINASFLERELEVQYDESDSIEVLKVLRYDTEPGISPSFLERELDDRFDESDSIETLKTAM